MVLKKAAAKPDGTHPWRHSWNKDRTRQDPNMSDVCLPVQELQVGDLSTLIIRAPLSLLLKKKQKPKHQERRKSGLICSLR